MKRFARRLLLAVAAVLVLAVLALLVLRHWAATDDFRSRVEAQASAAIGLPVTIARIDVDLWPVPGLATEGVALHTNPVLIAGRIEARLVWRALLVGRVALATVLVRKVDLPQAGIEQLMAAWKQRQKDGEPGVHGPTEGPPPDSYSLVPRRIVLDAVTVVFSKLVASSGLLSAKGEVSVAANRHLSGRVTVNLGAGMVGDSLGIPVQVGGTLDAPEITLTRAALVGAAIGTMVMPGVGTGAGASLGNKISDKLKGIFSK